MPKEELFHVKRDKAGTAAAALLDLKAHRADMDRQIKAAEKEVVNAMKETKRHSLCMGEYTVTLKSTPAIDSITITKNKETERRKS